MGVSKVQTGWKVRVRLKKDGRIFTKQETFSGTKEQAKKRFEDLKALLREEMTGERSLTLAGFGKSLSTFSEVLSQYSERLSQMNRLSVTHKRKIEYLKRELGSAPVQGFGDRFKAWLNIERSIVRNKNGAIIPGRTASPAKVNRYIEIVKAAFNIAVDMKQVNSNPVDKILFPKVEQIAKDVYLSAAEINDFLAIVERERPHIYPITQFSFLVPCRKKELVNAKIEDLDLINNVIRLKNGTTKNKRGVFKPIPPEMLPYFRSLPNDTEYIFFRRDKDGKALSLGDFRRSFQHCRKIFGREDIVFHDTRHISATHLVDNGTPERIVMTVANWKTNMLSNYYSKQEKKSFDHIQWKKEDQGNTQGNTLQGNGQ